MEFLSTSADIAVYGGAAGGGKTWALLAEPLRHVDNPGFGGVIFRKTAKQVRNEGGLWDAAQDLYQPFGVEFKESTLDCVFPSGAKIGMRHLQHEKNKYEYQGAEIPYIAFDELTHVTETQFFYLMSRNRSTSGVRPYMRATCNPDASSWVKVFLAPWVDKNYPMKAASGEIMWMFRRESQMSWWRNDPDAKENDDPDGRTLAEMMRAYPNRLKSVTFIASSIYDNKYLLERNPEYLGSLENLPLVERRRLLYGDWDIKEGDKLFEREWFEVVDDHNIPYDRLELCVRYWDLAATTKYEDKRACFTAGVLMGIDRETRICYILDVRRVASRPLQVEQLVTQTARFDGKDTEIYMEQEPGSAGKNVIDNYSRLLLGYIFHGDRPTGNKDTRARPLAIAASHGNIKLRRGHWNNDFLDELEYYPLGYKDQTDAAAGAFSQLAEYNAFFLV